MSRSSFPTWILRRVAERRRQLGDDPTVDVHIITPAERNGDPTLLSLAGTTFANSNRMNHRQWSMQRRAAAIKQRQRRELADKLDIALEHQREINRGAA